MACKKKLKFNARTAVTIFNPIIEILNVNIFATNLNVKRLPSVIVKGNGLVKMKTKIILKESRM